MNKKISLSRSSNSIEIEPRIIPNIIFQDI